MLVLTSPSNAALSPPTRPETLQVSVGLAPPNARTWSSARTTSAAGVMLPVAVTLLLAST
ncbi:hypothetical protein D3C86_2198840 [compost metagenome]